MKILAFIGLLTICIVICSVIGTVLVLLSDTDEYRKREKWSRTLDEDSRVGKDKKR
ncbi:MAG: hypothetical protein K6G88_05730 [Lachnospiraceae bacterium]|nr:hypothetical protein [Lachnospiraceae bacterium]